MPLISLSRWLARAATAVLVVLAAAPTHASGYIWLTAEYAGEGKVFRYNIQTGQIDLTVTPSLPSGGSHWNNGATDATSLYLGTPTTQYLGIADVYTGIVHTSRAYSQALGGHKEDGAVAYGTGNLWRVAYGSGELFETTKEGTLVRRFTGLPGNMVGLEWVGDVLYGTNYTGRDIGAITLGGSTAAFTMIPWEGGKEPVGSTAGLAYDPLDRVLYMATLTATKHNPAIKTFYNRLLAAGKTWFATMREGLDGAVPSAQPLAPNDL